MDGLKLELTSFTHRKRSRRMIKGNEIVTFREGPNVRTWVAMLSIYSSNMIPPVCSTGASA